MAQDGGRHTTRLATRRQTGQLDTDPSTRAEGSASLAVAAGLDGSIHVSYLGPDEGLHTSSCSASCGSAGSWVTEDLSESVDITGLRGDGHRGRLRPIQAHHHWDRERDLRPPQERRLVVGEPTRGLSAEPTGSVSTSATRGRCGAYAFYPGTSSAMTVIIQEGKATAGLLEDIDGDGWSRLEEQRCGTDHTDSGSSPTDSDGDGVCDLFDDWEDTSVSAESDALAIGEEFGCAVLSNRSVACWGDNSEGQLGSPSAGSSSAYAVIVDLPAGFEAGAVDAGSAHACSTGLDGKLVCWGRNTDGQLGRGTSSSSEAPDTSSCRRD